MAYVIIIINIIIIVIIIIIIIIIITIIIFIFAIIKATPLTIRGSAGGSIQLVYASTYCLKLIFPPQLKLKLHHEDQLKSNFFLKFIKGQQN